VKTRAILAAACLIACTACTDSDAPAPSSSAPSSSAPDDATPTCSARPSDMGEAVGTSTDGTSLHALLMGDPGIRSDGSIPVDKEIKIVVRMTGSGDLAVEADGPDREHARPVWGPEAHGGSTFDRPGDEWGVGFELPSPGCWLVRFQRSDQGSAVLALRVS
jgi:hypothetical protein